MIRSTPRRGFTLIEMMVVMALIATLAAMAMVVVPGIMEKDRSVDAVSNLQSWLQIAQARAQRDRAPRGLRLIIDTSKSPGSALTSPPTPDERLYVTEVQYIESPPVLVVNPTPPYVTSPAYPSSGVLNPGTTGQPNPASPYVEFTYTVAPPPPMAGGTPAQGTILSRTCTIRGLDNNQATQVASCFNGGQAPSLWLPVLGTWHRILSGTVQADPAPATTSSAVVTLENYPDAQLGASTSYRTYHFGIYGPPRPLLGEPTMQLPTNTCVDVTYDLTTAANGRASYPGVAPFQGLISPPDYDILFAPSGSLAYTPSTNGAGHVFLCVRDWRNLLKLNPPQPMDLTNLSLVQQGGEMMIIAIKAKSGAIGAAPVDQSGSPYLLAQQAVMGP